MDLIPCTNANPALGSAQLTRPLSWRSLFCYPRRFAQDKYCMEALMAVPKSKISNSRRGMRRAHDALTAVNYVEDKDSGELRRQHHIDLKTGMYKGRQVLTPKD